mmetsp:Transcript_13295/g.39642  ORF Transcript_13295/g.39642 Transcript_13295/m.39642 type:complete len:214 (-) Transcript_13295:2364-3005(-)
MICLKSSFRTSLNSMPFGVISTSALYQPLRRLLSGLSSVNASVQDPEMKYWLGSGSPDSPGNLSHVSSLNFFHVKVTRYLSPGMPMSSSGTSTRSRQSSSHDLPSPPSCGPITGTSLGAPSVCGKTRLAGSLSCVMWNSSQRFSPKVTSTDQTPSLRRSISCGLRRDHVPMAWYVCSRPSGSTVVECWRSGSGFRILTFWSRRYVSWYSPISM